MWSGCLSRIRRLRSRLRPSGHFISAAANLQRFLGSPRVSILLPDEQTTHHYAQLYQQLRKKGVAIPTNDLWIAALVVQHNLVLKEVTDA